MSGENPETSEQQEKMSSAKKKELERTLEFIRSRMDKAINPLIEEGTEQHSSLKKAFDAFNDKEVKSETVRYSRNKAMEPFDRASAPPKIDDNIKKYGDFEKDFEKFDLKDLNKKNHSKWEKTLHPAKSGIKSDTSSGILRDVGLKSDQSPAAKEEKRPDKGEFFRPGIDDRLPQSNPSDASSNMPKDAGLQSDKEERRTNKDELSRLGIGEQWPQSKLGDQNESRNKDAIPAKQETYYFDKAISLVDLEIALPDEGRKSAASNIYNLKLPTFESGDKTINDVSDVNYQEIKDLIANEKNLSWMDKIERGSILIDPILFLRNPESGELKWVNWHGLSDLHINLNGNFVKKSRHAIEILPRRIEDGSVIAQVLNHSGPIIDGFGSPSEQDPDLIEKYQYAFKLENERIEKYLYKGEPLESARDKAHAESIIDFKLAIWSSSRLVFAARLFNTGMQIFNIP
jgi:hypothetical protein